MLLDDQTPNDLGPRDFDDRGLGRLSNVFGPLNWRVGLVVGLALLTGGGATLARIEAEALADPAEAQTASTIAASGAAALELRQNNAALLPPLAVEPDESTSTTEASTSTSGDDPTTTGDSSTTSTGASSSSTTVADRAAAGATTSPTSTTVATDRRTTSTARGTTATTRASTSSTRGTTATTRATTTTARQTTTTQATTTTTQATTSTQAGNSCATGAEFELIMRDDFNGSSIGGQWVKWDGFTGNAGNGMRMASTLSVANGLLNIRAEMVNGTLFSGGINHTVAQTYGKYTVRVRTDNEADRVMNAVVLTWPVGDNHLRDGENNIYETLPNESGVRSPFHSFIHKPFAANPSQQEYKIWQADASQWQTMTMEWTPSRITMTRNGGETWTVNETGADLIPDVPHKFHIQLDATKQSMSAPVNMQVDFAEVYRYCG